MSLDARSLAAITLFTDDLPASRRFYAEVLGLRSVFSDDVSEAFDLGGTVVNLLHVSAAPELVTPAPVGGAGTPVRAQLTVSVQDVDVACAVLAELGVELLNGPLDRPWASAPLRSPTRAVTCGRSPPRSSPTGLPADSPAALLPRPDL